MGLITYNGVLLRKGDLLASSTDCCCEGCCCIDGAKDPTKTTKADCEAANGTWYPNQPCDTITCPSTSCTCPDCDDNVTLSLQGEAGWCDLATYQNSVTGTVFDENNTHGGMDAILFCEPDDNPRGIIWRVTAVSLFGNYMNGDHPSFRTWCRKSYAGTVAADANCLPVAGAVTLTLISTVDGGGCEWVTPPVVVVNRA